MNDQTNNKEGTMSGTTPSQATTQPQPCANQAPTNGQAKPTYYNKSRTHVPVDGYKIESLRTTPLEKLLEIATELGIENPNELKRQDLMFEILKSLQNEEVVIFLFKIGDFSHIQKVADFVYENEFTLMNSLKFNEKDWTIVVKNIKPEIKKLEEEIKNEED